MARSSSSTLLRLCPPLTHKTPCFFVFFVKTRVHASLRNQRKTTSGDYSPDQHGRNANTTSSETQTYNLWFSRLRLLIHSICTACALNFCRVGSNKMSNWTSFLPVAAAHGAQKLCAPHCLLHCPCQRWQRRWRCVGADKACIMCVMPVWCAACVVCVMCLVI